MDNKWINNSLLSFLASFQDLLHQCCSINQASVFVFRCVHYQCFLAVLFWACRLPYVCDTVHCLQTVADFLQETFYKYTLCTKKYILNWDVQMAVLCVAVLQLCSLSQVFMPARARISHGSWQICKCTPLTLHIQLVFLKQNRFRCFLDPQPTPGLELCAWFRFGYFGSPKLFTHDLWVFQCNLLLHRGLVGLGTHHYNVPFIKSRLEFKSQM